MEGLRGKEAGCVGYPLPPLSFQSTHRVGIRVRVDGDSDDGGTIKVKGDGDSVFRVKNGDGGGSGNSGNSVVTVVVVMATTIMIIMMIVDMPMVMTVVEVKWSEERYQPLGATNTQRA